MDQSAAGDAGSPYDSDRDGQTDVIPGSKGAPQTKLTNGDTTEEEENKFQSAISAWRSMLRSPSPKALDETDGLRYQSHEIGSRA